MKIAKTVLLAAGAFGLMSTAAPAQDYGPGPYDGPPSENVIVRAPPYIPRNLNGTIPEDATHLSLAVSYSDLDLRSARDAHELRIRIREAARDVCDRLAERIPYALTTTAECYRDAAAGGLNRADTAIHAARDETYYGYGD